MSREAIILVILSMTGRLADWLMTELAVYQLGIAWEANARYHTLRELHPLAPLLAQLAWLLPLAPALILLRNSRPAGLAVLAGWAIASWLPVLWNAHMLTYLIR